MNEQHYKQLIYENQNLVKKIASKYKYSAPFEDLCQVGCLALIEADKKFDKTQNTKFSTFAYYYIKGRMFELIREDKNIKLSPDVYRLKHKIEEVNDFLTQKDGVAPSIEKLSKFLELPSKKVIEIMNYQTSTLSIDNPIKGFDKDMSLSDIIPDTSYDDYDRTIVLKDSIKKLSVYQQTLLTKHYYDGKTQEECARELGINQVKVSRDMKKTLQLLKNDIEINLLTESA